MAKGGGVQINCRTILWYLTFVGMAVNYMTRINISITIVAMIQERKAVDSVANTAECTAAAVSGVDDVPVVMAVARDAAADAARGNWTTTAENETRLSVDDGTKEEAKKSVSIERKLLDWLQIDYDRDGFSWNEYEQGLALGSFYWLHWVTQVPGGILAKRYGPKLVYGLSNVLASVMCFLMPFASYLSLDLLLWLRVIQGLVTGVAWPAMHTMTAAWVPPNERSKFVTAYLGSSFGVFVNFPLFGYIISWSSWEYVFHFCGVFGTVWYICWCYLVYDSPAKHPRIDPEERNYIEKSLGSTIQQNRMPTPWLKILTSKDVWMNIIAQWGGIWGLFTMMTQAPTYFKYIHGWDIKMSGVLSGLPHLVRLIFSLFFSMIADYMLRSEKMSRKCVRKIATGLCTIVKGLFVLALAYSGCNTMAAIIFLTLAVGIHGAVSSGPLASVVDIAPNFAGIIQGLTGMIGVIPGFVSPIIVGLLTLNNQTAKQWEYVFLITAGMLIVSGTFFVLFADSKLQTWNSPSEKHAKELESLQTGPLLSAVDPVLTNKPEDQKTLQPDC